MKNRYMILDYETRSEVDLTVVGAAEYARHPSTEILCAAWRVGTREELPTAKVKRWFPRLGIGSDLDLRRDMRSVNFRVAQNALFEQLITSHVLHQIGYGPEKWICTAALAASHALPRKLEAVCTVLNLKHKKNPDGKALIKKHCVPQKITKKNNSKWNDDPESFRKLLNYCVDDIRATTEVFLRLPPLNPIERKIWCLDQKINLRGVSVDRPLVETILKLVKQEVAALNAETLELTMGLLSSTTKREQFKRYLADIEKLSLPNMQKKTIEDAITSGLATGDAKRLLEIRQAVSKTSTAKYIALEARSRHDGRLRDILLYWGASTGRFTGMGVQVHNFPRGTYGFDVKTALEAVRTGDLEWVRALCGDPMSAFSDCLRSMLIASDGHKMYAADFASIEVRVLFWIARHSAGLTIYERGEDAYRDMATAIYKVALDDVTKPQREVGKRAVLGCGYGMGWKKFMQTCADFGIPVTAKVAKQAVKAYRSKHHPVKTLWNNVERAAIEATKNKGKRYTVNRLSWFYRDEFLYCELPSGRRLAFYKAQVKFEWSRWDKDRIKAGKKPKGHKRFVLYHYDMNPETRQWGLVATYGGKLVENAVQGIARDRMCDAMLRIDDAGYENLISVHDENVAENESGSLEEFNKLMLVESKWAAGCPFTVEGWVDERYKK